MPINRVLAALAVSDVDAALSSDSQTANRHLVGRLGELEA
jgi:hypothetical protein